MHPGAIVTEMFSTDLEKSEAMLAGATAQNLIPRPGRPEEVAAEGREVFIHYAAGSADSKLKVDRLGVVWTGRNANTVARLLHLLEA